MKKLILPTLITMAVSNQLYANDYAPQINSERPNIVFIVSEDMSSRIGAFGDDVAQTPNLDAFAKESVRFTNVYTMAGVSAPSRAGLITGSFQNMEGLQHMRTAKKGYAGVPPADVKAYPELLRKNGYFTYNDVKFDYQFVKGAISPGPFTIWSEHGNYMNIEDQLLPSAWRNYDLQNKPFFVELNPQITHESGLFTAEGAPKAFKGLQKIMDNIRSHYTINTPDVSKIDIPEYLVDSPETRKEIARFYENINVMDQQVGNVIKNLKEDGLWDNTVVIFTTDHGDCLPRSKREGFVTGTHVPMMMHIPDKYKPTWFPENGTESDRLISFEDMAPTILGFAGVDSLPYMQGIDLSDSHPKKRAYVYANRGRIDTTNMRSYYVKDNDYQYVRNFDNAPNGSAVAFRNVLESTKALNKGHADKTLTAAQDKWFKTKPAESLYDLNKDPLELHNLAADPKYKAVLDRFRDVMNKWRDSGNDMGLVDEDQMIKDLLTPDGKQQTTLEPVAELDSTVGRLFISNRTSGASIGYSYDNKTWQVYNGSFKPESGADKVYIKAVRYGWKESPVLEFNL